MITLSLKDGGTFLGTIDAADLRLLVNQLEEEYEQDTDYYITPMTIDMLEQSGASPGLVRILKQAVGNSEGVEVAWSES